MLQTERQAVVAETAATESESRVESQSVVGAGRQAGGRVGGGGRGGVGDAQADRQVEEGR